MTEPQPIVVIRFDADGEFSVDFAPDAAVYVIDERAPHDRLYRMTPRATRSCLEAAVADGECGSAQDARHAAIANLIRAHLEGRRHLAPVDD